MDKILEVTDLETGNKLQIPLSKFAIEETNKEELPRKVTMISRENLIRRLSSVCVDELLTDEENNIVGYAMGNNEYILECYITDKIYKSKEE